MFLPITVGLRLPLLFFGFFTFSSDLRLMSRRSTGFSQRIFCILKNRIRAMDMYLRDSGHIRYHFICIARRRILCREENQNIGTRLLTQTPAVFFKIHTAGFFYRNKNPRTRVLVLRVNFSELISFEILELVYLPIPPYRAIRLWDE